MNYLSKSEDQAQGLQCDKYGYLIPTQENAELLAEKIVKSGTPISFSVGYNMTDYTVFMHLGTGHQSSKGIGFGLRPYYLFIHIIPLGSFGLDTDEGQGYPDDDDYYYPLHPIYLAEKYRVPRYEFEDNEKEGINPLRFFINACVQEIRAIENQPLYHDEPLSREETMQLAQKTIQKLRTSRPGKHNFSKEELDEVKRMKEDVISELEEIKNNKK